MAFYMNFPNTFDQLAGHTGSNIMLHATDTPDRLKQDYDSLGCVVVNERGDPARSSLTSGWA